MKHFTSIFRMARKPKAPGPPTSVNAEGLAPADAAVNNNVNIAGKVSFSEAPEGCVVESSSSNRHEKVKQARAPQTAPSSTEQAAAPQLIDQLESFGGEKGASTLGNRTMPTPVNGRNDIAGPSTVTTHNQVNSDADNCSDDYGEIENTRANEPPDIEAPPRLFPLNVAPPTSHTQKRARKEDDRSEEISEDSAGFQEVQRKPARGNRRQATHQQAATTSQPTGNASANENRTQTNANNAAPQQQGSNKNRVNRPQQNNKPSQADVDKETENRAVVFDDVHGAFRDILQFEEELARVAPNVVIRSTKLLGRGYRVTCADVNSAEILLSQLPTDAFRGKFDVHRSKLWHELHGITRQRHQRESTSARSLMNPYIKARREGRVVISYDLPPMSDERLMQIWGGVLEDTRHFAAKEKRPAGRTLTMKTIELADQICSTGLKLHVRLVTAFRAGDRRGRSNLCTFCANPKHNRTSCNSPTPLCFYCSSTAHVTDDCDNPENWWCSACNEEHTKYYYKCKVYQAGIAAAEAANSAPNDQDRATSTNNAAEATTSGSIDNEAQRSERAPVAKAARASIIANTAKTSLEPAGTPKHPWHDITNYAPSAPALTTANYPALNPSSQITQLDMDAIADAVMSRIQKKVETLIQTTLVGTIDSLLDAKFNDFFGRLALQQPATNAAIAPHQTHVHYEQDASTLSTRNHEMSFQSPDPPISPTSVCPFDKNAISDSTGMIDLTKGSRSPSPIDFTTASASASTFGDTEPTNSSV